MSALRTQSARVILKAGKDKPVKSFHPWVFSGAISEVDDFHQAGDLVRVCASDQSFLGIGYLNPQSQIAVRMLTFIDEPIDDAFWVRRLKAALLLRQNFISSSTNAYRWVNAEGDGLPGLMIDRYGDYAVVQFQTLGIEKCRDQILNALSNCVQVKGVYERNDLTTREREGMEKRKGVLRGEEPPDCLTIQENGIAFDVDLKTGQKTGFFLDQRENRALVGAIAKGKQVLNCFAYSGGFSVYAAKGGAHAVTSVEISEKAADWCRVNFEKQGLSRLCQHEVIVQDAFDYLRESKQPFDFIILDPPAFCKHKNQIQEAAKGYKDINLHAFKRLNPNGLLFTSSCSSFITADLFQKIVFGAAKDAKREVQIIKATHHAI
ncbi:MAG: hypothetical protein COW12_00935, partial [Candidatus Omnitrophica bacterium CG12_big_fil_rev_8_21_14_0_65_45_16]